MSDPKKMGRPKIDTEAITVRMSVETISTLDDLRRKEPDLPTRPEMIRRLVEDALRDRKA